jgi:hypothetical protein
MAMAENAPPAGVANAASDASRGMPYYERLRRDLRESLANKRKIDSNIVRTIGTHSVATIYLPLPGATRGDHHASRNRLPRRDERWKHHQRLRQLHQGRDYDIYIWRPRHSNASKGPNQRRGQDI